MCGIVALFRFSGPPDPGPLERMREALLHRGPDDGASVLFPEGGLAARRLAIMDPAQGAQPLADPGGRFWVAMNGEIYNFEALRAEEESRGTRFRTRGDTEVAAALVARLGFAGALARFDGMFALAAWDTRARTLHLGRDRFGEKPLYTTCLDDGTFLAASELRGLLAHGGVARRVDPAALAAFMLFEYVPSPRSIYLGVRRLRAGCLLRVDAQGEHEERWWKPPSPVAGGGSSAELRAQAQVLRESFRRAVRSRLRADVPVGFLLSGGIDSSSVLALAAASHTLPEPLHTFTLGMSEPSFDESAEARRVAEALGTRHHTFTYGPDQLLRALDALSEHLDEPLADSSLPAAWTLFEGVRERGFKVVLSGDGGDEQLAGYPTCLAHRVAHRVAPLLGPLAAPLRELTGRLPVSYDNVSLDYRLRRFVEGLPFALPRRNQVWLGAFLPSELPDLPVDEAFSEIEAYAGLLGELPPVLMAMGLDQRFYLGDGVLVKVDRASMAHGVEVRAPFLALDFVEAAARVPVGLKLRGLRSKAVWKEATRGLLPEEVRRRPKKGFGSPTGPWLRGPCAALLTDLDARVGDWVGADRVRTLVREHLEGRADHRRRLWTLIVLARWREGPWGPGSTPR
jgi:asparagine synthase (glutamine-hydrolysing)